jgi:hypothetical protein
MYLSFLCCAAWIPRGYSADKVGRRAERRGTPLELSRGAPRTTLRETIANGRTEWLPAGWRDGYVNSE